VNVAVTDRSAFIVKLHAAGPLQSPDQPVNVEPVFPTAVIWRTVPKG
jgi:hypothetical protein